MAFSTFPVEATTGLSWSLVNYNIILYAITTCCAVILLPEIVIDIMLVVAAFLFLLVSILCLAFLVVANSIRILIVTKYDTDESEGDDDLQQSQDELDVSYFKGGRIRTMYSEKYRTGSA
jgi:hypothetical protein